MIWVKSLMVLAMAHVFAGHVLGATYYIDPSGDDTKAGTSPSTAWKTLAKINGRTFSAGDSILFKRGGAWAGQLSPKGSGSSTAPIVIDAYDTGAKPVINGNGGVSSTGYGTVYLYNQQYWEIRNLEITNYKAGDANLKRGVYVRANNIGTRYHIYLINLDIHDVNGDLTDKNNGGIFFEITGTSTPSRFNDFRIEGCHVYDVDRTGISNDSTWADRNGPNPGDNINWDPSLNVIIRNNTIERAGCNGVIVRVADHPLIEHNVFTGNGAKGNGNAFFCFNTNNATIQYNEAYDTVYNEGEADAAGFDGDYRCYQTLFQYNYSHDNGLAGFVVVCDGNPTTGATRFNTGTIIRYNILENNDREAFRISGSCTSDTQIYNNTVLVDASHSDTVLMRHSSWGGYADHTQYYNNIIYNLGSNSSYSFGDSTNNVFDYNVFFGYAANEPADSHKLTGDPLLIQPGTGGIGLDTVTGYQLQRTSSCIDSGMAIAGGGGLDYFGNAVPQYGQTDRGAYEFRARTVDFDADGDADQCDFGRLQSCLTADTEVLTPDCEAADFNNDGHVNDEDATFFLGCLTGPAVTVVDAACLGLAAR